MYVHIMAIKEQSKTWQKEALCWMPSYKETTFIEWFRNQVCQYLGPRVWVAEPNKKKMMSGGYHRHCLTRWSLVSYMSNLLVRWRQYLGPRFWVVRLVGPNDPVTRWWWSGVTTGTAWGKQMVSWAPSPLNHLVYKKLVAQWNLNFCTETYTIWTIT